MTSEIIWGHKRSYWNFKIIFFCNNLFVQRPIFLKLFKNVNIMKTQIFQKIKYDLKGHEDTIFKNVSSSTSHKKSPSFLLYNHDLLSYGQLLSLFVVLSLSLFFLLFFFLYLFPLSFLCLFSLFPLIALNANLWTFSSLLYY